MNRILKRIANKSYSSFNDLLKDLNNNDFINYDLLDELIFKYWLLNNQTLLLLKHIIQTNNLNTISKIQTYINNLSVNDITTIIQNQNIQIINPNMLEQLLGINFNIDINLFLERFNTSQSLFYKQLNNYIFNNSQIVTYITNELKGNINLYINQLYNSYKLNYI